MLYLKLDTLDPVYNLEKERYFLENVREEMLILWQNDSSVILGKNQDELSEVNMKFARDNNIKVVKRITGGGAVYHDLGNVNFSFILPLGEFYLYKSIGLIMEMLQSYGVFVKKRGNDLCVGDRKISGMAMVMKDNMQLLHGTLLYNVDMGIMEKVLTPPEEKLERHGVLSIKSRVVNITDLVKDEKNINVFMAYIERFFQHKVGLQDWGAL